MPQSATEDRVMYWNRVLKNVDEVKLTSLAERCQVWGFRANTLQRIQRTKDTDCFWREDDPEGGREGVTLFPWYFHKSELLNALLLNIEVKLLN